MVFPEEAVAVAKVLGSLVGGESPLDIKVL